MNSHCEKIEHYLDGSLSGRALLDFESHLDSCPQCRQVVSVDSDLDDLIRETWSEISAPRAVLNPAVASHGAAAGQRVLTAAILTMAAAIVVGVVASVMLDVEFGSMTLVSGDNPAQDEPVLSQGSDASKTVKLFDSGGMGDAVLVMRKQPTRSFTIVQAFQPLEFESTKIIESGE